MNETIILVPGVGVGGIDHVLLRRRLSRGGYNVRIFWHDPWRHTLEESANRLNSRLVGIDAQTVHFVAHSLGGLVTLKLFQLHPEQRPGRIILLGSPCAGCSAARKVTAWAGGSWFLGPGLLEACADHGLVLPPGRQVGALAGTSDFGVGRLLALTKPNDSMVCVNETILQGLSDHLSCRVSHTGMLISRQVVDMILTFLRAGNNPLFANGK